MAQTSGWSLVFTNFAKFVCCIAAALIGGWWMSMYFDKTLMSMATGALVTIILPVILRKPFSFCLFTLLGGAITAAAAVAVCSVKGGGSNGEAAGIVAAIHTAFVLVGVLYYHKGLQQLVLGLPRPRKE